MSVKRKPHHALSAIQSRFATVADLEISTSAWRSAQGLGFGLADIVAVVQALEPADFVKSETAHHPRNSKVWHDSYVIPFDDMDLYLKFAGETLIDVALVSFKEK